MRAMVLDAPGRPLVLRDRHLPSPREGQVALDVEACGLCRTDLHVVDGELPEPKLPLVPGHQIVGRVSALGPGVTGLKLKDRVGVPWLASTCRACRFCRQGSENLCERALFTGYHRDGGFAESCVADALFTFPVPLDETPQSIAPLLCAGLIGYRAYRLSGLALPAGENRREGPMPRLGLYGFGAAAHILIQLARYQGCEVHAFTRPGDTKGQGFARAMGAVWAGGSHETPGEPLDAALIFAPDGDLVPAALRAVRKGGTVVCGGIHMSDIPSFPYALLWGERRVLSVANLTRRDGEEFLAMAPRIPVTVTAHPYPLEEANRALDDLRHGRFEGAGVIVP